MYPSFPIDVAVIRGTTADELGNVTLDEEAVLLGQLPMAQAAKNSGGIVIAQVKYVAKAGTLHPKHVRVPGPAGRLRGGRLLSRDSILQTAGGFDPALSGDLQGAPDGGQAAWPWVRAPWWLRRAAMELVPGAVVNLGVGYPDAMGGLAAEEGVDEMVTLTTEPGAVGGVPGADLFFGTSATPRHSSSSTRHVRLVRRRGARHGLPGPGADRPHGNVNVSRFKRP